MMLKSKNVVVFILIITIFLSIILTIMTLRYLKDRIILPEITGKASSSIVDIDIKGLTEMRVSYDDVNFGSGEINETLDLSTEQINPGTFNPCIEINGTYNFSEDCRGIQIDNIGNTYLNLTMISTKDAKDLFLGDNTTSKFRFTVVPGNISRMPMNSCLYNAISDQSIFPKGSNYINNFMNWTEINKSFIYTICNNFSFSTYNRSLVIEINVTIPYNEGRFNPGTERTAYLLFIAQSVE